MKHTKAPRSRRRSELGLIGRRRWGGRRPRGAECGYGAEMCAGDATHRVTVALTSDGPEKPSRPPCTPFRRKIVARIASRQDQCKSRSAAPSVPYAVLESAIPCDVTVTRTSGVACLQYKQRNPQSLGEWVGVGDRTNVK